MAILQPSHDCSYVRNKAISISLTETTLSAAGGSMEAMLDSIVDQDIVLFGFETEDEVVLHVFPNANGFPTTLQRFGAIEKPMVVIDEAEDKAYAANALATFFTHDDCMVYAEAKDPALMLRVLRGILRLFEGYVGRNIDWGDDLESIRTEVSRPEGVYMVLSEDGQSIEFREPGYRLIGPRKFLSSLRLPPKND